MIGVEVENFQSIVHLKVEIDGFTTIVGDSDLGKSAIIRAIRAALTGAQGTDFVRHGASCERRLKGNKKCRCFASVRISTSKYSFLWNKGDGVNRYTVDWPDKPTEVFDRVDRGTPDFLLEDFGPLKIGDASTILQVAEQFRVNGVGGPIFLLDASGSAIAEVLSDVARLDSLNDAIRLVQKDKKEASSTRTVRERDVRGLRHELEAFQGLDGALNRAQAAEANFAALEQKQHEQAVVAQFLAATESLATAISDLERRTARDLPDLETVRAKQARLVELDGLFKNVVARAPDVRRLTGVDKVTVPVLTADMSLLQQADSWWRRSEQLQIAVDAGVKAADLNFPDLEAVTAKFERLRVVSDHQAREQTLNRAVAELESQLAAAEQEEANALAELRAMGMCPTCLAPIGQDAHLHLDEAS